MTFAGFFGSVGLFVSKGGFDDVPGERESAFVEHKDSLFENTQLGHSGYGLSSDSSRAYGFLIVTLSGKVAKVLLLFPKAPGSVPHLVHRSLRRLSLALKTLNRRWPNNDHRTYGRLPLPTHSLQP